MDKRIARVFPRRTKATPTDDLAFTTGPGLFPPEVDEVHVSVAFTWDLPRAEWLARQWEPYAPVKIGGPAVGTRGDLFTPGMYLRPGYVITSRGCPNHCWFCSAWKRDGDIRELPVRSGWNVLDDNLLACSDEHVTSVFDMLSKRPERVEFTGGLEAARLQRWHVEALWNLKPKQMFFAYDEEADLEPLRRAGEMLLARGWSTRAHRLRCYVLVGYPKDTMKSAEHRLREAMEAGFWPMAMLWRDGAGRTSQPWRVFQRRWARPSILGAMVR